MRNSMGEKVWKVIQAKDGVEIEAKLELLKL